MRENICKSYIWKELILKYIKNSQSSLESLQVTNAEEGMQKKEPSYTVSGNVNWQSYSEGWYGGSLTKEPAHKSEKDEY